MDGNFQLIDIVVFIGICQGIFLSITLQRISNNNHQANAVLSKLILIATFMLIGRFLFIRYLNYWVFQWSLLFDTIVFLFGPWLYIYIRRLLFNGNSKFTLPFYHWLPFVFLVTIAGYFIVFYTPKEYYQLFEDGFLPILFNVVSALMISFNVYYLIKSIDLVKKFKRKEKHTFSFSQSPLTYLNAFLISISLCLLAWILGFINEIIFNNSIKFLGYNVIWIAIPIFIYVIGYFSLKQPELFRIPLEKIHFPKKKARLSELECEILQNKLNSLMINEKMFLQNNLTLREVSETLNTSTNNISWLLNNVYKSTFYDYINKYRIQEFIKNIEANKHLTQTILALSMDVGFNSKSTFNKAFKLVMNDTPSAYIKKRSAA